jgi:cytochrome c-type biogenesis protein CcmH
MNEWWLIGIFLLMFFMAIAIICFHLQLSVMKKFFILCFALFFVSYIDWRFGGVKLLHEYHQGLLRQQEAEKVFKTMRGPEEVIDKLKGKLSHDPSSARGWYLLGRLYSSQHQFNHATEAFAKAHRLEPLDEKITVNYAEAMWEDNQQLFNTHIRQLLRSVLEKNPNQPDALSMLAMDAFKRHAYKEAIKSWRQLLLLVPEASDDAKAIQKAIFEAEKRLNHTK